MLCGASVCLLENMGRINESVLLGLLHSASAVLRLKQVSALVLFNARVGVCRWRASCKWLNQM